MKLIESAIFSTAEDDSTTWSTVKGLHVPSLVLQYNQPWSVYYNEVCSGDDRYGLVGICPLTTIPNAANSGVIFQCASSRDDYNKSRARIAVISAALGESTTQYPHVTLQSIPVDFILFTNAPAIIEQLSGDPCNLWSVDSTPYHSDANVVDDINVLKDVLGGSPYILHSFYKTHFHRFPSLKEYEFVIWLEPTIIVHSKHLARDALFSAELSGYDIAVFEYLIPLRDMLSLNVHDKREQIYRHSLVNGEDVISRQFSAYRSFGYSQDKWAALKPDRMFFGNWCTDFLAYNMKHKEAISALLSKWFEQIVEFSSPLSSQEHDSFSFSFVTQMALTSPSKNLHLNVLSLPSSQVNVTGSFRINSMFQNTARRAWKFE